MGRKRFASFEDTAKINRDTYDDILIRMSNICMNVFEWEGIPDTVNERFLEKTLFYNGVACYLRDEIIGGLALSTTLSGKLDVYGDPVQWVAYGANGYNKVCNSHDSVLIWNNYMRVPTFFTVRQYARRLYEIQRAIDVNVKAQKTPVMILSPESQRLTMKNLYLKYDGNEPFIFGDNALEIGDIQALRTDAPFVSDKLHVLFNNVWNEFLTFCGVENMNVEKKERVVEAEAVGNYGNVEVQRNVFLDSRRKAAEQINKLFGTNINVRYRSDVVTLVNRPESEYSEVEEDE
jgi:hypothetical protein